MIKYEYRSQLIRFGAPHLLPNGVAQSIVGFSSVYGFPEETATCITTIESIKGIQGLPLYSDTLYLDIDNSEFIPEVEAVLRNKGVGFSKYTTGNRGCHFHVPCEPVISPILPSIHKAFVENWFPGADLSLYKYSGIIRNVGTWHIKNPGRRKELLEEVPGKLLVLDILPPKNRSKTFLVYEELDDTEADFQLGCMLLRNISEGKRNNTLFMMAFLAKTAGYDTEEATDILWGYNCSHVSPPIECQEFKTIIKSCYR